MPKLLAWATRLLGTGKDEPDNVDVEVATEAVEGNVGPVSQPQIAQEASPAPSPKNVTDEDIRMGTRAYRYVMQKLGGMPWDPPLDTPDAVASWLDISEESLLSLQRGDLSELPNIREAFKELFQGALHEKEIESYLNPRAPALVSNSSK